MSKDDRLTEAEVAEARRRREVGMALQAIEGNPLTAEEVTMFEMFERERWSFEKRRAYILDTLPRPAIAAE